MKASVESNKRKININRYKNIKMWFQKLKRFHDIEKKLLLFTAVDYYSN